MLSQRTSTHTQPYFSNMIRLVNDEKMKKKKRNLIIWLCHFSQQLWPCSGNFYFVVFLRSFWKFLRVFICLLFVLLDMSQKMKWTEKEKYSIQLIYDFYQKAWKCCRVLNWADKARRSRLLPSAFSFSCMDRKHKILMENIFFIS